MNISIQRLCLLALICLVSDSYADIVITPSTSVPGPITINDTFDVDVDLSGWNSGVDGGADGISLDVNFNTAILEFVSVSGDLSTGASPTSWLGVIDGAGDQQSTVALSDSFSFGSVGASPARLTVFDNDVDAFNGVTLAASGAVGTVTLKAVGLGTSSISVSGPGGNSSNIFTDEFGLTFTPSTALSLGSTSMTVVPEPSIGFVLSILGIALVGGKFVGKFLKFSKK